MRFDLIGAAVLVAVGCALAVVGSIWDRAYNAEYDLTVADAIAGKHTSWITPGPKMAQVSGFALRSQVQRITIQSETINGRTVADRAFFPLRVPDDNRAIVVSVPWEESLSLTSLFDTADQRREYAGVLEATPRTQSGVPIEQQFEGVTFPTRYCLVSGATGGDTRSKWLARCGIALALCGILLAILKQTRRAAQAAHAAATPADGEASVAAEPAPVDVEAVAEAPADEPALPDQSAPPASAADAMAAMAAVVAAQDGGETPDEQGGDETADKDQTEGGEKPDEASDDEK